MKALFFLFTFFNLNIIFSQNIDYDKFKGVEKKVNYLKELSDQSMYLYVDKSYTEAKSDQGLFNLQNKLAYDRDNLSSIFRFTFTNGNIDYSIYKFKIKLSDSTSTINTKLHSFENGDWKEVDNPKGIVKIFFNTLKLINVKLYKLLISNTSNPEYPEINKIKRLVKNEQGILDIEKLANAIRNNKQILEPYLD